MRRQFTLAFKLKVIKHYEDSKSFSRTSKEFIIDRKTLRSWVASKEQIKKTNLKSKRTKREYNGSRTVYPEMERQVYSWLIENRIKGVCVGSREIKLKALSLMKDTKLFVASPGWLASFLIRHKILLRRITTTGARKPKNFVQTVQNFVDDCESNFSSINRDAIFNMDETAIYLDSPSKFLRSQL
jgi:transposase-like protein